MKKLASTMTMIVVAVATLFAAWPAQAVDYFKDSGVKVSGEPSSGRIHIKGAPADIEKYVRGMGMMTCPDQLKEASGPTCNINVPVDVQMISPNEAVLQLDMKAVAEGKRAFNFVSDSLWSQAFPGKAGENVVVESLEKNGQVYCHYTYIGDLPEGSYIPNKPELCGKQTAQPATAKVIKPTAEPAATAAPVAKKPVAKKPPRNPHRDKKLAVAKTETTCAAVGEIDKTEPLDEQTLQQKSQKILKRIAKIEESVAALEKSIGTPAAGETVLGLLKNIDKKVTPSEPKQEKTFWDRNSRWIAGAITATAVLVFIILGLMQRRRNPGQPK